MSHLGVEWYLSKTYIIDKLQYFIFQIITPFTPTLINIDSLHATHHTHVTWFPSTFNGPIWPCGNDDVLYIPIKLLQLILALRKLYFINLLSCSLINLNPSNVGVPFQSSKLGQLDSRSRKLCGDQWNWLIKKKKKKRKEKGVWTLKLGLDIGSGESLYM
jgi:hypothetical protein